MKIRVGFVSNSSGSNFICDLCGSTEYFYEMPDCYNRCENGHVFCDQHTVNIEHCPICFFEDYSVEEMKEYLYATRKIPTEEVFAYVKSLNKRRKVLYPSEYNTYVFEKFNLTDELILEEIRSKFKDWQEFSDFCL